MTTIDDLYRIRFGYEKGGSQTIVQQIPPVRTPPPPTLTSAEASQASRNTRTRRRLGILSTLFGPRDTGGASGTRRATLG